MPVLLASGKLLLIAVSPPGKTGEKFLFRSAEQLSKCGRGQGAALTLAYFLPKLAA